MKWRKREGHLTRTFLAGAGMRTTVALLVFLAAGFCQAQQFQSWNEVDLTASWKNVDLLVPLLARVDPDLPNPQLAATGITADFPLYRHLILTGGYLFAVVPERSLDVHLPLVALTPTFRFHRFVLADRNRLEKLIGFANSPVRYRNRFFIDAPFGAKEHWHAFVDDEVIFNLTDGNWNQNRFQVGSGRQLASRLFLDIYYLRRNLSAGAPAQNVLGSTLRVNLKRRTEVLQGPDKS
jgi:hypothetical protein